VRRGHAYVDSLSPEKRCERSRHAPTHARKAPYRERGGRGEPESSSRRCGWEGSPTASKVCGATDRHGRAQHQPARPDHVSHPPRRATRNRRGVVHNPTVRLGARLRRVRNALEEHHGHSLQRNSRITGRSTNGQERLAETGTVRPRAEPGRFEAAVPQQVEFARLKSHPMSCCPREKLIQLARKSSRGRETAPMPHARRRAPARLNPEAFESRERIGVAKSDSGSISRFSRTDERAPERSPAQDRVLEPVKLVSSRT